MHQLYLIIQFKAGACFPSKDQLRTLSKGYLHKELLRMLLYLLVSL